MQHRPERVPGLSNSRDSVVRSRLVVSGTYWGCIL